MGQLEDLNLFVAVVDHGSIAKAANQLGIAKSAVSRRLAQLEDRYDTRLIDRRPGAWSVTDAGKELYQRSLPMLSDAQDLDADFMQTTHNLSGPLRVTVAYEFGMIFLKPMLFQFAQDHPDIDLTIDFDDRTIDLERENYDLAIRVTAQDQEGANEVKLGTTRHGMFASPDYLKKHGHPAAPSDLRDHALLHYGSNRRPNWTFGYDGKPFKIEFKPALNSNTGSFLKDAAVQGMGIIRLPDFVVHQAAKEGSIVPVLANAEFPKFQILLIQAPNRRLNKRMRAFAQATRDQCAAFRM